MEETNLASAQVSANPTLRATQPRTGQPTGK